MTRVRQAGERIEELLATLRSTSGRVYARMPDAIETAFFQLSSPVPVTVVSRTTYDAARPIRLTHYVYRADRLRLRHEMGTIPVS